MRTGFVTLLLVLSLTVVMGGTAGATSENAADRACQGAFVSEAAKTEQPVGATVSQLAGYSFGKFVSGAASTC